MIRRALANDVSLLSFISSGRAVSSSSEEESDKTTAECVCWNGFSFPQARRRSCVSPLWVLLTRQCDLHHLRRTKRNSDAKNERNQPGFSTGTFRSTKEMANERPKTPNGVWTNGKSVSNEPGMLNDRSRSSKPVSNRSETRNCFWTSNETFREPDCHYLDIIKHCLHRQVLIITFGGLLERRFG